MGFVPFGGAAIVMQMPVGAGGFAGKVVYMAALDGFGFAGGSRVTMGMTIIATGFAFIVMFVAWNIGSGFGNPPDQVPVAIVNQSIRAVLMNVITYWFTRVFTVFVMVMSFAHISLLLDPFRFGLGKVYFTIWIIRKFWSCGFFRIILLMYVTGIRLDMGFEA
jgi:hypothetical protein